MSPDTKNIGLRGIVVADTKISLVDGEEGRLLYRGYAIQELAERATFEEIVYLLMHGCLPDAEALRTMRAELASYRGLPPEVFAYMRLRRTDADPMEVLQGAVALLSDHDPDLRETSREARVRSCLRLIARTGMVVAAWHNVRAGREPHTVDAGLSHAEAFLFALWGRLPTPDETKLMDTLLALHAEHTFNASTFAVRGVASTKANLYVSVSAGVGALSGPLHGGANARVMEMLMKIGDQAAVEPWVRHRIEAGQRVMGFGHAVYKTEDPRADVLRKVAQRTLAGTPQEKWFALALEVDRVTRTLLKELKGLTLYPNVDFYSGGILNALGLANDMFPAFFAVSRVSGWCAHYVEEEFAEAQPKAVIYRPEANYVGRYCGPTGCSFVPIEQRGAGCPCGKDVEGCNEEQALAKP